MTVAIWAAFGALILILLALDLGVFNREARIIPPREALAWTGLWSSIAVAFSGVVYYLYENKPFGFAPPMGTSGLDAALQYFAGYLIEQSLSLDNIFVIALILSYFRVPGERQHGVLFWGVLGALVMRAAMIIAGTALIRQFDWMMYVFGALLLFTAGKLMLANDENIDPEASVLVRMVRRLFPVTKDYHEHHFFVRVDGKLMATPLFLVLVLVESTDLLFAVDSIPAVFSVTTDPFLVFTSNVFAILGLRSLYFALAGLMDKFRYFKTSLVILLAFIGLKMMIANHFHIPLWISLCAIVFILSTGILASVWGVSHGMRTLHSPLAEELPALAQMTLRQARRIVVLITGSILVLAGVIMLVAPGPGILVIIGGLGVLATEFVWARYWLKRVKETSKVAMDTVMARITPDSKKGGEDVDGPKP